jgi:hypothetical protein
MGRALASHAVRWIVLVCLTLLSVSAPANGVEGEPALKGTGSDGAISGALIEVKWRLNFYGKFAPEATLLLQNRSDERLAALVDFRTRVCDGKSLRVTHEAGAYYKCELENRMALVPLSPHGWNAFIFSLGVPIEDGSGPGDCVSEILVKASDSETIDRMLITIPVPVGGWEEQHEHR